MPSRPGTRPHDRLFRETPKPPPGSVLAGYGRYSSEMQDDMTLETQRRIIGDGMARESWQMVFFAEPATSAKHDDINKRPVFAQMLQEVCAGTYAGVVVYDLPRWSRNVYASLDALLKLQRAGRWWQTADGRHTINSQMEEASGLLLVFEMQIAQGFSRKLSKRTIDAKEDHARIGLHNGYCPIGYQSVYDPPPAGVGPKQWRPDKRPYARDPQYLPMFALIATLQCQGYSDRSIAARCTAEGCTTRGGKASGPRLAGLEEADRRAPRAITKDIVAAIVRNPFYREFRPECGHGTIITPSGQELEGQHEAMWDWETWHRMLAQRRTRLTRPNAAREKTTLYPFARMLACAACRRPMRCYKKDTVRRYYTCASPLRGLSCPAPGTTPAWRVEAAFGDLLSRYRLGDSWRDDLAALSWHASQKRRASTSWRRSA